MLYTLHLTIFMVNKKLLKNSHTIIINTMYTAPGIHRSMLSQATIKYIYMFLSYKVHKYNLYKFKSEREIHENHCGHEQGH